MSRYQKGKTNLDLTEATDSEWQWHQLGHMQVCTSLQTGNHASTPPLIINCQVNANIIPLNYSLLSYQQLLQATVMMQQTLQLSHTHTHTPV